MYFFASDFHKNSIGSLAGLYFGGEHDKAKALRALGILILHDPSINDIPKSGKRTDQLLLSDSWMDTADKDLCFT